MKGERSQQQLSKLQSRKCFSHCTAAAFICWMKYLELWISGSGESGVFSQCLHWFRPGTQAWFCILKTCTLVLFGNWIVCCCECEAVTESVTSCCANIHSDAYRLIWSLAPSLVSSLLETKYFHVWMCEWHQRWALIGAHATCSWMPAHPLVSRLHLATNL